MGEYGSDPAVADRQLGASCCAVCNESIGYLSNTCVTGDL
jgi:hypothetical protein